MPNLLWRTHPRKFGKDSRECRRCKCQIGLIRKYDLLLCRKCFREYGEIIGFTKTRWKMICMAYLMTFTHFTHLWQLQQKHLYGFLKQIMN